MNLNIGCGHETPKNYINVDRAPLPNVNVVCDLSHPPWPFGNDVFESILAINILEHLPDTVKILEEFHRISKSNALIKIRVPYWNSFIAWMDPTHVKTFHQRSLDMFDPTSYMGRKRSYYSRCKFRVKKKYYWIRMGWGYLEKYVRIENFLLKIILSLLAVPFCNVITMLEFDLITIKEPAN